MPESGGRQWFWKLTGNISGQLLTSGTSGIEVSKPSASSAETALLRFELTAVPFKTWLASTGLEPATFALLARRSNQLS